MHFLMGKICKQLGTLSFILFFRSRMSVEIFINIGRRDEAMIHFTTALDLDPKDSNMIKLSIDKLDSSDVDENDEL